MGAIERSRRATSGPAGVPCAGQGGVLAGVLPAALIATLAAVLGMGAAIAQQAPRSVDPTVKVAATVAVTLPATLDAPAVALAPYRGGVAALDSDGRLTHATPQGDARRLRRGLTSEVLVACEGGLLAIDGSGRLIEVSGDAVGPPVSLHATPLCLPGGRVLALDPNAERVMLLDATLKRVALAPLDALPDAEPIRVANGTLAGETLAGDAVPGDALPGEPATRGVVAIPVHPSLDYRHGVLGDEVEAGAVAVVDAITLEVVARWDAPGRRVIEQRRLASFPAAGRWGMVATVSGGGDGGALVVLAARDVATRDVATTDVAARDVAARDVPAEATVVATGSGIGMENRWRHVLGTSGRRLYTLATPHIGGPLERWTLPASIGVESGSEPGAGAASTSDGDAPPEMRREAFSLGVTSHQIGQRELDLGTLLPRVASDRPTLDLLLLPTRDLRTLRLIACDGGGCHVAADAPLPGRMAAAPSLGRDEAGGVRAWVATDDGSLLLVTFPRDTF